MLYSTWRRRPSSRAATGPPEARDRAFIRWTSAGDGARKRLFPHQPVDHHSRAHPTAVDVVRPKPQIRIAVDGRLLRFQNREVLQEHPTLLSLEARREPGIVDIEVARHSPEIMAGRGRFRREGVD